MASNKIGPQIAVDGEKEYRQSIDAIVQQTKTLQAQLKTTAEVFKSDNDIKKRNAEQTKILTQEIKNQEKFIDDLKRQYSTSVKETGEYSKATEQVATKIANAELALQKMKNQLKEVDVNSFANQMKQASEQLKDVGDKFTKAGTTLSTHVTAPITALGAASIAAFNEVDKGADTIIKKTGATGDALKEMTDSMNNIATSIPTSFDEAGTAIGEVNTRFELTGQELEDLSGQFIKFANINGIDVNSSIDTASKLVEAYGLSIEDTSLLLDHMNATGQATGISMDTLGSQLLSNSSTFRSLGYSVEDSITLLGQLELGGYDASTVLNGLGKVQKEAISNGTTMESELTAAFSSADSAMDVFGKSGAKLFEMFDSGQLSLDLFTAQGRELDYAVGSVSDTFDATLDPIDQWQLTLNQLKTSGADLGNSLQTVLAPMLEKLADAVKGVSEWFNGLSDSQKETIVKIGLIVAAIGPALVILGKVATSISAIIGVVGTLSTAFSALSGVGTALTAVIGGISLPVMGAVAAIAALVAGGVWLYKNWETVMEWAGKLKDKISEKWNGIKDSISNSMNNAKDSVHNAVERIKGFFNFHWELPKLKMPHFSITGSFSLKPPSVPHIGVEWYRKAYDQIYGFNLPTIIPTASGYKGFGDGVGTEIVVGENKLISTISKAVGSHNGMVVNITVNPSQGMDEAELAQLVSDKIQEEIDKDAEVYA